MWTFVAGLLRNYLWHVRRCRRYWSRCCWRVCTGSSVGRYGSCSEYAETPVVESRCTASGRHAEWRRRHDVMTRWRTQDWRHARLQRRHDVTHSDADVTTLWLDDARRTDVTHDYSDVTGVMTSRRVTPTSWRHSMTHTWLTSSTTTPTSMTLQRHWRHAEWRRIRWLRRRGRSDPLGSTWRTALANPILCRRAQAYLPRSESPSKFPACARTASLHTSTRRRHGIRRKAD